MGVEVFARSEEETKLLGGRFHDIENARSPGEIEGEGDTEHIKRGGLLELRAGHEKRSGGCVELTEYKEALSLGLIEAHQGIVRAPLEDEIEIITVERRLSARVWE